LFNSEQSFKRVTTAKIVFVFFVYKHTLFLRWPRLAESLNV